MDNLKDIYHQGVTFISLNDGQLTGCIYIKSNDIYIPFDLDDSSLNFIKFYPNVMERLIEGETIYLPFHNMYIGTIRNEAPYGEDEYFVSNYNSKSNELTELLINLDKNIFEGNKEHKKMLKNGNFYTEN